MMRKDESDLQHGDVCEIVQKDNGVLRNSVARAGT